MAANPNQQNLNRNGLTEEAARALGVRARASTFKEKVWVNPSRTLYITNIAPGTTTEELESLFKHLDGFIALRRVRSMCFVDFDQKQQATAAMWKTNGHKFKPHHEGLLVSYDKDDNEEKGGWSMRKREEEKQKKQEADATRVLYRCAACNHFCLKTARPLSEMPERRTDKSRVVDCAIDLVTLMAVKGGTKLLRREKGVERQFRFNCELCDACVAYRSVPYEQQDCKYIYVFPEAVSESRSGNSHHHHHHTNTTLPQQLNGKDQQLPPPPPVHEGSSGGAHSGSSLASSTAPSLLGRAPTVGR